ncbi:MAG: ATP-binding cassette domain-containing protein [Verrucomicrobiota bacterium]
MATPLSDTFLSATELSLSFGRQHVLNAASLAVQAGEKVGIVGRNGCGKSSFLRILAGVEAPDSGSISFRQGLVSGYLPQEFQLDEEATVEANIRAGAADLQAKIDRYESGSELSATEMDRLLEEIEHADGWNLQTRMDTLMRKLDAPPADRIVQHLSGGEKRRVGICRALVAQPDLLILDEPTNHLDAAAIEWLERYLAEMRGAVVFVTHDRYFLDRIATHIAELADGRFFLHEGNYSDYLVAKAERIERIEAAEARRQKFLKREVEWVRAGVSARRTKQQSRLDNYYAVKAQKSPDRELNMELVVPKPPPLGNIVAEIENAGARIDDRWLFHGLSLELTAGECIGIVGPNGAGKTTLLRVLMGEREPDEGSHRLGKKTVFNYVDQSRAQLDEEKSVMDDVGEGKESVKFGDETLSIRAFLRRFLFTDERINDRIGNLSGGEKNRVLLAKILKRGGNVLIFDEPTNDLDLQTLRVLEEALINFEGTSLVVSHDRWFLDRVCDRVLVFEDHGQVRVSVGNYSYYLEKRKGLEAQKTAAASAAKSKKKRRERSDKPRKLTWKENKELEGMEDAILKAESEVSEIEGKLNDPSFFVDHAEEAAVMAAGLDEKKRAIQQLYERWEELEAIRLEAEK